MIAAAILNFASVSDAQTTPEPIQACVIARHAPLTSVTRPAIATCLGWYAAQEKPQHCGFYKSLVVPALTDPHEFRLSADQVDLKPAGQSVFDGHVHLRQSQRILNANTAYVIRDPKTKKIREIQLLGDVEYMEAGRLMWADKMTLHPEDGSGKIEKVLYRFDTQQAHAKLPAWGRSRVVERFANQNYLLSQATYTTCAPREKAWQIEAREIKLNTKQQTGEAKDALLRVGDWPVFYSPYLTFPTSNKRKSGFLMPMYGYSNVGGFDFAPPYYWNIAPAYDATFVPHLYTRRGTMAGGDFRYLTSLSNGVVAGHFLPHDNAFNQFLLQNKAQYPTLQDLSSNRWSLLLNHHTRFTDQLDLLVNYRQVSDDYYLQDFSNNLALLTENQLPREGQLTYSSDHWLLRGLLQSYQTLSPVNQSPVSDVYQRLPQLLARGSYDQLPLNGHLELNGQFDYFQWPTQNTQQPQGPRSHFNPILSFPLVRPWGYITPSVQWMENYYDLHYNNNVAPKIYNVSLPRYNIDTGLSFERSASWGHQPYVQTLEPRLYYLNVPYQNQSDFPAFDSAYMIFNTDQVFRWNRFSGFDRTSDANQLGYGVTSRWLSEESGQEKALVTVAQLRYFSKRRVQLCYQVGGQCVDSPLTLGYIDPDTSYSPIASRAVYHFNPAWFISGDYAWDPSISATNNGYVNLHYQPTPDRMLSVGYTYLLNGNLIDARQTVQQSALNQATFAYGWPLSEKWSTLGIYSYNISKGYSMLSFFGLQYDTCCWAVRLLGGRSFQSLTPNSTTPQYNNNGYIQILLKGLGSVANTDPASTIQTYLPGYENIFH